MRQIAIHSCSLRPIAQAIRDIPMDHFFGTATKSRSASNDQADASTETGEAEPPKTDLARPQRRPLRRLCEDEETEQLMRERLIVARNLNGLDQQKAAEKLGYKNSSQLSKVESGEAPFPKSLLRRAAYAYGVSSDWLLGLSNEPERDSHLASEMAVMRAVREAVVANTSIVTRQMLDLAAEQMPLANHVRSMLIAAHQATTTFDRCCRNNASFQDDIRGGASLTRAMDDLQEVVIGIEKAMARSEAVAQARIQQPILDPEEGDDDSGEALLDWGSYRAKHVAIADTRGTDRSQ